MTDVLSLQSLLPEGVEARKVALRLFALLSLGVVESLESGVLSTNDAIRFFFHFDNHWYVKKKLKYKSASLFMARGGQLDDLFTVLPAGVAHREFYRELTAMRSLCLKILDDRRVLA